MRRWTRVCAALLPLTLFTGCSGEDELPDSGIGGPAPPGGGTTTPGGQPGGIGDRCETDRDCKTELCLPAEASTNSLTLGTPPGGLCTARCEEDDDCPESGTFCVPFSLRDGYCVPSCLFGTPAEDENKCYGRPEMSCQPLLQESGISCDTTLDCPEPLYCLEGECSIAALCMPRCNSNQDCPEGRFCEPALGECVKTEPRGKALGESCNPNAATEECRGVCVNLGGEGGECVEFCTLGAPNGCGYEDATRAPVVCAIGYDVGEPLGALDDGICATVCACNDDCPETQRCVDLDDGDPLCMSGVDEDESLTECTEGS